MNQCFFGHAACLPSEASVLEAGVIGDLLYQGTTIFQKALEAAVVGAEAGVFVACS
jgi:hypothetical protein